MQFSNIALFGLVAIATAVPVEPVKRSAASIKSEITTVNTQLHKVDNDVLHYTGGILGPFQLVGLIADVNVLQTDANTLSADVTATGPLSAADSADIATGIAGVVTTLCTTLADAATKVCGVVFGAG
jgi:hypothetical protein